MKVLTVTDHEGAFYPLPALGTVAQEVTREYRLFGFVIWTRRFTAIDIEVQETW